MCALTYIAPDAGWLARLRRVVPFPALRPEEVAKLVGVARLAVADPGTTLASSGERTPLLLVILEGSVALKRDLPRGQRCLVDVIDAPCLVGEVALFDDRSVALAAEAVRRVVLAELPAGVVLSCLGDNPAAQLRLLGYMSARLKRLIIQIANLKLMNGPQRLAHYLATISERRSSPEEWASGTVRLPFEKQTLAALLGMTPESLSRAFRRLDRLGIRTLPGGEVRIPDVEVLRHFAEPDPLH